MEQDYTIDQVAEMIQVHRKTVEEWIHTGKLDAYQLEEGGRYRIRPSALEQFRASRLVKPRQARPRPRRKTTKKKNEGDLAPVA